MAQVSNIITPPGKIPNSQLRALDFIEKRTLVVSQDSDDSTLQFRSLETGVEEITKDPVTPAAHLMRQREIFREKTLELIDQSQQESEIGVRDIAIAGQRNWIPIGPAGVERGQALTGPVVSGRVKGIAVAPGGKRVYVATANGGVWYSSDTGHSWTPLMNGLNYFPSELNTGNANNIGSLACGAIALFPGNSQADDLVYVGTGDGNGITDSYVGVGPLVSKNGGLEWNREESTGTVPPAPVPAPPRKDHLVGFGFFGMAIDPDNPQIVVAATSNGIYVREPAGGGLYQWNQKAFKGISVSGIAVAKKGPTKTFFAATWWGAVHSSPDGINWTLLGTGFPPSRVGRIAIATKKDNPQVVYALVAAWGIVASPNADNPQHGHMLGIYRFDSTVDNTWRKILDCPIHLFGSDFSKNGQGNYDITIAVAPDNVNRIYCGGSTESVSGVWAAAIYRLDLNVAGIGTARCMGAPGTIGANVHADVHCLAFTPNEPEKFWIGCDGGIFYTDKAVSGTGHIFKSLNKGLQTLTLNHLGLHPKEEEVLFCGVQDNGGIRYIGEDIWLHSTPGDGGTYLVNWIEPIKTIINYNTNIFNRTSSGGNRPSGDDYDFSQSTISLDSTNAGGITTVNEQVDFYGPLAHVSPPDEIIPSDGNQVRISNFLAFGTQRPWISTDFGKNWYPLPSRRIDHNPSFISDRTALGPGTTFTVTALTFQGATRLLVGLSNGRVYRYTDTSANNDWTVVGPVENLGGMTGGPLPATAITDFTLRPDHPNEFYVCLGGIISGAAAKNHVWHFDGAQWTAKPGTDVARSLIDIHCNTMIAADADRLFVGTDVGVWASTTAGADFFWDPFSFGLPETAIIDLQLSKRNPPSGPPLILLRASTYGRGVFEFQLSPPLPPPAPGTSVDIELYLRDHILDKGRYPTRRNMRDPRDYDKIINTTDSPDIKVMIPDKYGIYPYPPGFKLSPGAFLLDLADNWEEVPVPESGTAITRVLVQVHNRSAFAARYVRVMLLVHPLDSDDLPQLPAGYDEALRAGWSVDGEGWKTVGIKMAESMQAGRPAIVEFEMTSSLLPSYSDTGLLGKSLVLVALLHHNDDAYTTANQIIDPNTDGTVLYSAERKIAIKRIKAKRRAAIPNNIPTKISLAGFSTIPASATESGAPFDEMLANSFKLNDEVLHEVFASGFAGLQGSRGITVNPPAPNAGELLFADELNINTEILLKQGQPLIWRARNKITLTAKINGKGKGAATATEGDFGGSGGGSPSQSGKRCVLPLSTPAIEIAAASVNNPGADLDPVWASRASLVLPYSKGGGSGGDSGANQGGPGGAIVVLCAPEIVFAAGGEIDVSGEPGAANAGGGGGGLVLLIACNITGVQAEGATPNIKLNGGGSAGNGKTGGKGLLIQKIIT